MSGTRSPFPREPATEALIVAHGQPSDPGPAETEVAALAARVEALTPRCRVRGVTLAMPGALEAALSGATSPPTVYPLFMSDGWFTASELPRRLAGAARGVLPPLGLDPALADLAAGEVAALAAERGWPIAAVTLVIAAHGSGRSRSSARAARRFAVRIRRRLPLAGVRVGYIEQAPSIADVSAAAGPRAICLPFFANHGGHVFDDIPLALDQARFEGVLARPIGAHSGIAALIADGLKRHATDPLPNIGHAPRRIGAVRR